MHSSVTITLVFLTFVAQSFSVPLPAFKVEFTPNSAATQAQQSRIDKKKAVIEDAALKADSQVQKMKDVLKDPNSQRSKEILEAAFGKPGINYNPQKVESAVEKMDTEKFRVDAYGSSRAYAEVPYTVQGGQVYTNPARVGDPFMKLDKASQAGTLIHEASHQQSQTGDAYDSKNGRYLNALESYLKQPGPDSKNGYWVDPQTKQVGRLPTSVAEVNKDKDYQTQRDTAPNNHDNAEAYAVFGGLCASVARRDLLLFRRALLDSDEDERKYLVARAVTECKLPPDYFEKKAAAKTAATARTASSETPATVKAATKDSKSLNAATQDAKLLKALPPSATSSSKKGAVSEKSGSKSTVKPSASALKKIASTSDRKKTSNASTGSSGVGKKTVGTGAGKKTVVTGGGKKIANAGGGSKTTGTGAGKTVATGAGAGGSGKTPSAGTRKKTEATGGKTPNVVANKKTTPPASVKSKIQPSTGSQKLTAPTKQPLTPLEVAGKPVQKVIHECHAAHAWCQQRS